MTATAPVDLTEYIDSALEDVDERGFSNISIEKGSPGYDALGLALAVSKLIDFGGGILRLQSGHKFKLLRPCAACEVAAPMVTPGAIQSKFCARCANELATKILDLTK